ncbi:hydantoinase B/oxoprolinase family protein [Streptomyces sp. ODS28]|uniref:hydantoinase B/oxoprolinase family protein n=1 Tax=Streptomyces sp. ODS28 TaxID=3136688 RepID=UPI0031E97DE1
MTDTTAGAATAEPIDPITVQVIGNAMTSIAEEMGAVLRRASYSTNIKERCDCSTGLFDAEGRLVAQAENMPIHMGSMAGLVRALLDSPGADQLRPGDVYITNDPYTAGGTHLPDITAVAPVFAGEGATETLIGFSANIAHHSDVGGRVPGSNSGDSTSLFQEGLRIPVVRFARAGEVNPEILAFITLNSRLPQERRGDMFAQLSSVTTGARRLVELHERHGTPAVASSTAQLLAYAERRLRAALRSAPDGTYAFTDHMDAEPDGEGGLLPPTPVTAAVTIAGEDISVDFQGTGPQSPVGINVVRSALEATVYYAVKAVLDPGIPPNGGFFDAVRIEAPEGSILNPRHPAPVTARTDTCQRVADVLLGALAKAVPDRVPAGCHSTITYVTFSGQCGDDYFVYPEVVAGGFGGRPDGEGTGGLDGMDAVQVHVSNSSNLPIEALELEYPLRVDQYRLIADSGGAGARRGGLGVRRDIHVLAESAEFSAHADRQQYAPWGLDGGDDGTPGRFSVLRGGEREEPLAHGRVSGVRLAAGDVLRVESPGSGGHGHPWERDAERVREDVYEGRVTGAAAEGVYGVVLDGDGAVDRAATEAAREVLRNARTGLRGDR